MNANKVKVGQQVTTSGFPGTIREVCEWSRNEGDVMVVIQLDSGQTCVTCKDVILAISETERDAARYRWLKAQAHKGHYLTVDDATVALVFQMEEGAVFDANQYGLTLDAVIDRAIDGEQA